jgi:hypothetical protein
MEPISLILSALAVGASTGFTETAGQAVKDAYTGLKALLRRKLGGERPTEQRLTEAGVDNDEEIIRAAQRVLALVDPDGARAGKYNVAISGGRGIVVGDHAQVTMTFGDEHPS